MPDLHTLVLFTAAALVLAAMPGPGLFYVAGRTLAAGRGDGLASCVGTGLGGLVHVAAAALGVSALIVASASAFSVLKLCGGLYLIVLGVQAWRAAGAAMPVPVGGKDPMLRALRQAVIVEATNPKTAIFFLALVPQFIAPAQGYVALQFVVLGLIAVTCNTAMDVVIVLLAAGLQRRIAQRPAVLRRIQKGSALLLGGLGASLLIARRPA